MTDYRVHIIVISFIGWYMWKIAICILFLNSLAIAAPGKWSNELLNEFNELGHSVIQESGPKIKRINGPLSPVDIEITEPLKTALFMSKGKERIQLKRYYETDTHLPLWQRFSGFSCRNKKENTIRVTNTALRKFQLFFGSCLKEGRFEQPKTVESRLTNVDTETPLERRTTDTIDAYVVPQSALSELVLSPQYGPPIVCVGHKTTLNGQETTSYVCYPFIPTSPPPQSMVPSIYEQWDAGIFKEFQELGGQVIYARAQKQSFKISNQLLKILFEPTNIEEYKLKSFRQAVDGVEITFMEGCIRLTSKQLENFKRFFTNCISTSFEQPALSTY